MLKCHKCLQAFDKPDTAKMLGIKVYYCPNCGGRIIGLWKLEGKEEDYETGNVKAHRCTI